MQRNSKMYHFDPTTRKSLISPVKERKETNQIIIINKPPSIALVKHFPTSSCSFFFFQFFYSWQKGSWEDACCSVAELCPTLCNPLDSSPSSSSVHGIFQARILEWVAISFSRGSSQPRDWNHVSCISCIRRWILYHWATWEAHLRRCSIQFSCSVISDSLRPHGLQYTRLPCLSPTPRACSNSCPLSRWCHPTISCSVVPFSHLQSFPASGSFPMSQFFTSGGQNIGASASTSVLPMDIQDWFPLGWTGWISLQSKGLSRVFSNTTVQKHQFFAAQLSLWSNSHIQTWLLEKP